MYPEEEMIPLSYLSQYYYCKRRAGLIMLEQVWNDNIYTAEGTIMHERAHDGGIETRKGISKLFNVYLRSHALGICGKADCIEIFPDTEGALLPWREGRFMLHPVDYKRGEERNEQEYEVQLCAQGMCLEEMLNCHLSQGAVYYAGDRERVTIEFTKELRDLVVEGARALHDMMRSKIVPRAEKTKKCTKCSIDEICMPGIKSNASRFADLLVERAKGADIE